MPSLFKKRPQTAQQKAQRAQTRVFVRLACCAYIIFYIILPLIRNPSEEDGINHTWKIIVVTAFIAGTAAIIIVTIIEIARNWKAGLYKASAYKDDEVNSELGIRSAEIAEEELEEEEDEMNSELEDDEEDDEEE